jgi:hypothetical protein
MWIIIPSHFALVELGPETALNITKDAILEQFLGGASVFISKYGNLPSFWNGYDSS